MSRGPQSYDDAEKTMVVVAMFVAMCAGGVIGLIAALIVMAS